MHIIYAVTTCSDRVYRQLFEDAPRKPAFQSQKYHRLLIEGLAAGAKVDVVANPPVNREVLKKSFVRLPRETEGGACYRYIPAVRNPIVKAVFVGVGTFFRTARLAGKDSAVVVDCLNRTTALAGLLAAKLRGRRCVGIVTDLPDMLGGSAFSKKLSNFVIRHCTDYVLLTQAMNDYLNPKGKPHVILEGHSDIAMERQEPSPARKASPRVCLYAGGVSKQYGLENLVKGFQKANLPDARLEIYGPGDYVQELSQIAAEDYVKYSFPSKTMEYMSTGTPVLTTVLPGMPKEYHPYVYLLEEETADAIAEKLGQIFAQPAEALFEKGMAAREFILKEKNNVKQAGKT